MTKPNNLRNSYIANCKLFFYRFPNWIFALIILFISMLGVLVINNMAIPQKESKTKADLTAEYRTSKETALNALDVIEGRLESLQPYDNRPEYANELKNKIALYDFYLSTETCENDYIILDNSFVNWWTTKAKLKGVSALNVSFILGIAFVFLCILLGSSSYKPFYSKHAKLFLCGNINKSTLISGRTLFLWIILATFLLFGCIAILLIMSKASVNYVLFAYNDQIITQSIYCLLFFRLLFTLSAGWFFYNLTTFFNTLTKKSYLAFIISLIILGGLIGIGKLAELISDFSEALVIMPFAGLLFNNKGFFDFSVYYNLPLTLSGGILLYWLSLKKLTSNYSYNF